MIALKAEVQCHRALNHPNIVKCLDCFQLNNAKEVAVITELCPEGDLLSALKLAKNGCFEEDRVQFIATDLINGLQYLHCTHNLIHRDLKLQVCLIYALS